MNTNTNPHNYINLPPSVDGDTCYMLATPFGAPAERDMILLQERNPQLFFNDF